MKILYQTILPISIVITLSGCALTSVQKEAVSSFAQASADIGDFASTEFNHFRSATIDMNVTDVAIRGEKSKSLLKCKIDSITKKESYECVPDLDEALKPVATIERVKSAQALSSYGKVLLALVNETQEAELKKASSNFVDSFKSISKKSMSNAQLEGLGQLVQAIGSFWVEAKKANAVKEIVKQAEPDVNKLCNLLIDDFTVTALHVGSGVDKTISNLAGDAELSLKASDASYSDRLIAIGGLKQAWGEREHLNNVSKQAIATLTKLQAANKQLLAAIEEDSLSIEDIKALGKEVNDLRTAITALSGNK